MEDKASVVDALLTEWSEWAAANKLAGLGFKSGVNYETVSNSGFNQTIISLQDERCIMIETLIKKLPSDEYQAVVVKYLDVSSTVANTNNYTMHRSTVHRKMKRVTEKLYPELKRLGLIA